MNNLFNVEINHPFYSIHYVAENVPIKEAVKIAKKYSKIFCPKTVFIEKIFMEGETKVHESISYSSVSKILYKRRTK